MTWWLNLQIICRPIAGYGCALCMLLSPYIYFSIGRQFDKLFTGNPIRCPLDIGFECWHRFYRAGLYAGFIAFPKLYKRRKEYYQQLGGYDLRGHASALQIMMSKIYFFVIFSFIPCIYIGFGPTDPTSLMGWFKVFTRQCTNC